MFSAIEKFCALVTILVLCTKKFSPEKWHSYQNVILRWGLIILVSSFTIGTVIIAPYLKWSEERARSEGHLIGRPNLVVEQSGAIVTPVLNQPERGTVIAGFAVSFVNRGTHTAEKIVSSLVLIDQRFEGGVVGGQQVDSVNPVAPERPFQTTQTFQEVVRIEESVPVYAVCQIRYADAETKQIYHQVFFYRWNSLTSVYRKPFFDDVSQEEKTRIIAYLKRVGYPIMALD